ncbi:hypothetical protein [Thalassotalea ganghwensis]
MPLPLFWLGAAALSAFAVKAAADDRKNQQQSRTRSPSVQRLSHLKPHESPIAVYPSDWFSTEVSVKPKVGALVCCGIGGILDHTGIWIDDNLIVELDGEGLVKAVSPRRFTQERSGKHIYIACDSHNQPLCDELAAQRAIKQIFTFRDYHLIENNCHQFIWQCINPNDISLSTFKELNLRMAKHFDRKIYWDLCAYD